MRHAPDNSVTSPLRARDSRPGQDPRPPAKATLTSRSARDRTRDTTAYVNPSSVRREPAVSITVYCRSHCGQQRESDLVPRRARPDQGREPERNHGNREPCAEGKESESKSAPSTAATSAPPPAPVDTQARSRRGGTPAPARRCTRCGQRRPQERQRIPSGKPATRGRERRAIPRRSIVPTRRAPDPRWS